MEEAHMQECICHKILSLIKLSLENHCKNTEFEGWSGIAAKGPTFILALTGWTVHQPLCTQTWGRGGEECWCVGDENSFPAFLGILECGSEVIDTCLSTLPFIFYNLMFTFRATETRIRLDNINKHFHTNILV